jgi:hypothetical protein
MERRGGKGSDAGKRRPGGQVLYLILIIGDGNWSGNEKGGFCG